MTLAKAQSRPWDTPLPPVKLSAPTLRGINRYRERHGLPPLDAYGEVVCEDRPHLVPRRSRSTTPRRR
jgi:hypothetical protein